LNALVINYEDHALFQKIKDAIGELDRAVD